jgi:hypothetical protein
MAIERYSQLSVIADGRGRGAFSLWSLTHQLMAAPDLPSLDLAVEDVMESIITWSRAVFRAMVKLARPGSVPGTVAAADGFGA